MVAGRSWSPTSSCTVVACEGPATTKIGRIRAAIPSLGPDNIEESQFGSRIGTCRTSRCNPSRTSGSRTRRHSSFGLRSVSEAESAKIMEAEKQKQIFEQELAQAEKDLIGFRQEAECRAVVQLLRSILSALEAELSRVRAELVQLRGVGQETFSLWTQCQTNLPHRGACSDSTHANKGSNRVECMVGRTSFRIARALLQELTTTDRAVPLGLVRVSRHKVSPVTNPDLG